VSHNYFILFIFIFKIIKIDEDSKIKILSVENKKTTEIQMLGSGDSRTPLLTSTIGVVLEIA
jgi:hypothetical protein